MVTKELYKLEKENITKSGHTMFKEDIVKELNGWRNSCRKFRNNNALLLRRIGTVEELLKFIGEELKRNPDILPYLRIDINRKLDKESK